MKGQPKKIFIDGEERWLFKKNHGMTGTRIYIIWKNMRRRCSNVNDIEYKNYGGRGIKVCDRWMKFENFYSDMKDGYSDKMTLDRMDVYGDYFKDNCRWATIQEQAENKQNTLRIVIDGESKTISEWARIVGINRETIWNRMKKGWSGLDAVKVPVRKGNWHYGEKSKWLEKQMQPAM